MLGNINIKAKIIKLTFFEFLKLRNICSANDSELKRGNSLIDFKNTIIFLTNRRFGITLSYLF
jgi:hypothetical protein